MAMTCKAEGCSAARRPENILCRRHWFMLPYGLRRRISQRESLSDVKRLETMAIKMIWDLENSVVLRWSGTIGGGS